MKKIFISYVLFIVILFSGIILIGYSDTDQAEPAALETTTPDTEEIKLLTGWVYSGIDTHCYNCYQSGGIEYTGQEVGDIVQCPWCGNEIPVEIYGTDGSIAIRMIKSTPDGPPLACLIE